MLNQRGENKVIQLPRRAFHVLKTIIIKNSREPEIAAFEPRKSVASCRVQGTCVDGRLQSDNKATTSVRVDRDQGPASPEDLRLSGRSEHSRVSTLTGSVRFLQRARSHLQDMAICLCASIGQVGARRRALATRRGAPSAQSHCPHSTAAHPPPHNFIDSSSVTIYHVPHASYSRIFKFLTLPSYLPSCPKVLPKADQERPPHPSACPPVAGLRLYYRHNRHPPRSSSTNRQISQWR